MAGFEVEFGGIVIKNKDFKLARRNKLNSFVVGYGINVDLIKLLISQFTKNEVAGLVEEAISIT